MMFFSNNHVLARNKLKRNNGLIILLELETKIAKLEMRMMFRRITHNTKFIEILNQLNVLERKQMIKYDVIREYDIKILTASLNDMEIKTDDIKKEVAEIKPLFNEAAGKLEELNNKVYTTAAYQHSLAQIPEHSRYRCA